LETGLLPPAAAGRPVALALTKRDPPWLKRAVRNDEWRALESDSPIRLFVPGSGKAAKVTMAEP